MTIEESIENLVLLKKLEDSLGNIGANTDSVVSRSLGCAIETMRKYQKIQEIVTKWSGDMRVNTTMAMCEIEEVMEDGNDD